MRHYEIEGPDAIHEFCFVSVEDPSLDAQNEVAPHKAWFDVAEQRLKVRNLANNGWVYLGEDGGL